MKLKTTLFGNVYQFKDVKEVLAKANELRSGMCWQVLRLKAHRSALPRNRCCRKCRWRIFATTR
ncbi:ethanolamine ammonia-lyase heavy chain [Citrobacter koseri]|nr:ethanolamine ammonia-lyase heavy chain [Citrobacter koseri]